MFSCCVIQCMGYLPKNTLEHSMSSCSLILDSLNQTFDNLSLRRRTHKSQGRKLGTVWRQNTLRRRAKFSHKNIIYSQYFSLNSQCPMKHTFSFHRVNLKTSRNMTAKKAETAVRRHYVGQPLLSSTARTRLRTRSTITSQTEGNRFLTLKTFSHTSTGRFNLRSSLYIINLRQSYRGMKRHYNLLLL